MAIAVDQNYDKAQRKISTANLEQFAGVDCQLLVEKETHRPIIMDGATVGGKFKCASTDELKAVETVANNAISQAYADEHYLGKTAKAVSAGTADTAGSATKATQDASGNVITSTYATKTEVTSGLSGKLGKTEKASSASTADAVAWTGVSGKPNFATVATSGSYNDLKNKPSTPNAYITASSITPTQQAVKFSNGLVIMSGKISEYNKIAVTVTFPYAFTSNDYSIFCFPASASGGDFTHSMYVAHDYKTTSSCKLSIETGGSTKVPSPLYWFAIGK